MRYPNTESILDAWEPDTPPSERYNQIIRVGSGHVLELRDPNSGQIEGAENKPRHQYARAGGWLWTRRLPPESLGDEWRDAPSKWETMQWDDDAKGAWTRHPIALWASEGHEFPLVDMRRQKFFLEGDFVCMIRGKYVDVGSDQIIGREWPCGPCITSWWDVPLPPCPDCGGDVVWWEAGYVPGTRRCVGDPISRSGGQPAYAEDGGCGSMFSVGVDEEESE